MLSFVLRLHVCLFFGPLFVVACLLVIIVGVVVAILALLAFFFNLPARVLFWVPTLNFFSLTLICRFLMTIGKTIIAICGRWRERLTTTADSVRSVEAEVKKVPTLQNGNDLSEKTKYVSMKMVAVCVAKKQNKIHNNKDSGRWNRAGSHPTKKGNESSSLGTRHEMVVHVRSGHICRVKSVFRRTHHVYWWTRRFLTLVTHNRHLFRGIR